MQNLLVPKEKPVLIGLDSYYIHHEKFIEHLRDQFGAGCVHFSFSSGEAVLFFNENKFLPSKLFKNDQTKDFSTLTSLLENIDEKACIDVYYLSSDAISFWSHLPAAVDQKEIHVANHRELKTTIESFKKNHFSGYLSITDTVKKRGGILFFGQGEFLGGSYSWGKGGLDSSSEYRNQLAHLLDSEGEQVIRLGQFLYDQYVDDALEVDDDLTPPPYQSLDEIHESIQQPESEKIDLSDVELEEETPSKAIVLEDIDGYISAYHRVMSKKNDTLLLKEKFLEHLDKFPFLDPFLNHVDYSYGAFHYHGDENEDTVARAIITCIREIVQDQKMNKKFLKQVEKWPGHKNLLEKEALQQA